MAGGGTGGKLGCVCAYATVARFVLKAQGHLWVVSKERSLLRAIAGLQEDEEMGSSGSELKEPSDASPPKSVLRMFLWGEACYPGGICRARELC